MSCINLKQIFGNTDGLRYTELSFLSRGGGGVRHREEPLNIHRLEWRLDLGDLLHCWSSFGVPCPRVKLPAGGSLEGGCAGPRTLARALDILTSLPPTPTPTCFNKQSGKLVL